MTVVPRAGRRGEADEGSTGNCPDGFPRWRGLAACPGAAGLSANTCETYCPFGGVVALFPLVKYRAYACTLNELNVALLVSLVALTIISKKAFCSWVCPLGWIQEWIGKTGRKVLGRSLRLPRKADLGLMAGRYVVLAVVVGLTYTVWQFDLGFRRWDPFYILFTWGGHGTARYSAYVVAASRRTL